MTLPELLPCPHCGELPEFIPHINDDDCGFLSCSCGIETSNMEKSILIEVWNNRESRTV